MEINVYGVKLNGDYPSSEGWYYYEAQVGNDKSSGYVYIDNSMFMFFCGENLFTVDAESDKVRVYTDANITGTSMSFALYAAEIQVSSDFDLAVKAVLKTL